MSCEEIFRALEEARSLFFVGIGGISMSSIAFVFRSKGYVVRGSDRAQNDMTAKLCACGIEVFHGHNAENIIGADAVIYTGAVNDQNPELVQAKKLGLPIIYRADALAYLMKKYKTRIGVSGSHGKSTCTSMISHILISCGKDPTVMCGAQTAEMGGAYRVGKGNAFVFEACEYKDSFLDFFPSVSVILNIDLDHTDYFTDGIEQIKDSFRKYAMLAFDSEDPFVVACADDENSVSALDGIEKTTFGIENDADYTAKNIVYNEGCAEFDISKRGEAFCHVKLSVLGKHNVYNALAACTVCDRLGIASHDIAKRLSDFEGLSRRFEKKGSVNGADVYIDYAHHPKELISSIDAAKRMSKGRVICVFEPHTYSRTAALFNDFASSFDKSDKTFFVDIYAARETNTFGVSSKALADVVPRGEYAGSYGAAAEKIRAEAKKGDTVLILGAGTVNEIAEMLVR